MSAASDWTDPSGIWADTQFNILFQPPAPLSSSRGQLTTVHPTVRLEFLSLVGWWTGICQFPPKFQPPNVSNPWPVRLSALNSSSPRWLYYIDRILVWPSIIGTPPYSVGVTRAYVTCSMHEGDFHIISVQLLYTWRFTSTGMLPHFDW
jgi:hypothetical protein